MDLAAENHAGVRKVVGQSRPYCCYSVARHDVYCLCINQRERKDIDCVTLSEFGGEVHFRERKARGQQIAWLR